MPYMNGFQLSERILEIYINGKICYMSSGEINLNALRALVWDVLLKGQLRLFI
jgi:hypothetical protein